MDIQNKIQLTLPKSNPLGKEEIARLRENFNVG